MKQISDKIRKHSFELYLQKKEIIMYSK